MLKGWTLILQAAFADINIAKDRSVYSISSAAHRDPDSSPGLNLKGDRPMFPLDLDKLTPEQRAMVSLWEEHLKAEFQDKDARASCDTMVANPYVNHVPVLTGGVGRRQL